MNILLQLKRLYDALIRPLESDLAATKPKTISLHSRWSVTAGADGSPA